jgi:hypothetical protein
LLFLIRKPESLQLFFFLVLFIIFCAQTFIFQKTLPRTEKILIKIGEVLGFINTRIILALVFYLAITPLSILFKIFGKNTLDINIDPSSNSYWKEHDYKITPLRHKRQF